MSEKSEDKKVIRYMTTDNTAKLSIQNYESRSVHLFHQRVPFMLILETCREEDHLYSFYQISLDEQYRHTLNKQEYSDFLKRPQHFQSFVSIVYILSGEATICIENQIFTYHAGDCIVMNRNILYKEDFFGNFELVFLNFQEKFIEMMIAEEEPILKEVSEDYRHYVFSPVIQMLRNAQKDSSRYQKTYFDCSPNVEPETILNRMTPIFNTILFELLDKKPGCLYLIRGYLQKFLSILCDPSYYTVTEISSALSRQAVLLKKIRHVVESKHGKVTRKELAEQFHYNEEYLNRIIKQNTGMTFSQYRQQVMLREAERLLTTTDMSISKITEHLGMSNRSFFYQLCENQFGMKPLEYREKNKESK